MYHGFSYDLKALRRKFSISLTGITLETLMKMATELGFSHRALKIKKGGITTLKLPAILYWENNHFVVLESIKKGKFQILDPDKGKIQYSEEDFFKGFSNLALELTPTLGMPHPPKSSTLKMGHLLGKVKGLKRNILAIMAFSIILQLFILSSPFFLQISIDEAIKEQNLSLLSILALGFGAFTLINTFSSLFRGYFLLYLGSLLNYQMALRLFHRLMRLPLSFFEKRHIGDIISRFGSTEPIRELLVEGLPASLLDGVMALTTLALIYLYSPFLFLVSLASFFIYLGLRLLVFKAYRTRNETALLSSADEQSNFMETVRGIMAIKLFNKESDRESSWKKNMAQVINDEFKVGEANLWFDSGNALIFGIEYIVFVFFAVKMVVDGDFSIGMVYAVMVYKKQFTEKSVELISRAIDLKMIGLHLERISDIALAPTDPLLDLKGDEDFKIKGEIELKNISFSYSFNGPLVLNKANLKVRPGETVALVGPSGQGKTTLLKLILGLFTPLSGQVLIDGKPLCELGIQNFRKQVAAVMQDDSLFSGPLSENIALDKKPDMEKVVEAAHMACILDDINDMPMKFETLVGDMGTSLSGGQKQRVLLARALYQRPKILFLDEATAHLDLKTERMVNNSIRTLGITRVLLAHRPDTILLADRIIKIIDKELIECEINEFGKIIPLKNEVRLETT